MINKPDLTEEEIVQNYEEFLQYISDNFEGDRREKLLKLHGEEGYGMTLAMAPASMAVHFHNCFPGGYILHVMNVIKCSEAMEKIYVAMGAVPDWSPGERRMAALCHDMGKLGDPELGEYYAVENQDWKRRRGEIYCLNPKIQYLNATDRTLFVLQKYNITISWRELVGIMLADGMYREANVPYLKTYNKDISLKTQLPILVHLADMMSSVTERENWRKRNS